jgi:hypothetical protein
LWVDRESDNSHVLRHLKRFIDDYLYQILETKPVTWYELKIKVIDSNDDSY